MKDQWMAALDMRDFHSLEELRGSLYAFVQQYNQSPHSSLRGLSPQDRFFSEPEQIRRLSEEDIRQNFLLEIERRVSADSVIVIDQIEYEVDYRFSRQRIRLRYSPDMKEIFIVDSDGTLTPDPTSEQNGKRIDKKRKSTLMQRRRMIMDYTARYGLEFNPFLKNSKEVLVETQEYKEVLFRLNYLLTTKGFGLLTGSAGRGKTTAVRNWASGLNTSLYKVVYSSLSTLTVNDFYRNLAAELGAQPAFRKTDNFKIIQDEINRLVLEKRQTPVIIIDEANYIGNAVLNDLKMLFNFEMDSKDRAVVLLSGLPQLNSTLRLSIHEPFRQRIVMNYNLEGMTKAEGHSYVAAKLNGAGCTQTVFEDNALEAILNAANGTPRMINKLCNASLLVGNSSNLNIITADAVMQAINDCELG